MVIKNVVILDGCGLKDQDLAPILQNFSDLLRGDGCRVETVSLRQLKLGHCLGCFGCWVKTPGRCVEDDAGRHIARAVIQSDATLFFTPVTFGGYSPELKRIFDRFIQLISPYFRLDHGEVHHPPRYTRLPRLIMVGAQRQPNPHEARIFRTLAGRNAINFCPPSYAAEVVLASDPAETLRRRFAALLTRCDAFPYGEAAASLMPQPVAAEAISGAGLSKRALLIIGSPKTNRPSTSSVLGDYLLGRLAGHGWETESLTLRASLNREEGQAELLRSVDRAGLILLVFPLYADALPFLVTKALEVMAAGRRAASQPSPKRLLAVVNSGFPETHQNSLALAICQEFAAQTGIAWSGGLALGGGGIVGSKPLTESKRSGPPVLHIIRALDLTAAALAQGQPAPPEAMKLMARNPIPMMPFALWRWIYMRLGGKGFEREAARNGIPKDRLLDQPYAV
jgi:hypothetical protein